LVFIVVTIGVYVACLGNVKRTSWLLTTPADGAQLGISVYVGGCDDFDRIAVTENQERVTIEAYVRTGMRNCGDDVINAEPKTVRLQAPLGNRLLQGCNPQSSEYYQPGYPDSDCRLPYNP
jgi:hypothetical protein